VVVVVPFFVFSKNQYSLQDVLGSISLGIKFTKGGRAWKIQIQDLNLSSQLSPRDQVLATFQQHQFISFSFTYLYSLTEGY
jgi:hypothetical protein